MQSARLGRSWTRSDPICCGSSRPKRVEPGGQVKAIIVRSATMQRWRTDRANSRISCSRANSNVSWIRRTCLDSPPPRSRFHAHRTPAAFSTHARHRRCVLPGASGGALPSLYAATAPDVHGGEYFGPDDTFGMTGSPARARSSSRSKDMADASRLWSVSEELTGVTFAF